MCFIFHKYMYLFISQTGIAHLQQPLSNCTASVWHVTSNRLFPSVIVDQYVTTYYASQKFYCTLNARNMYVYYDIYRYVFLSVQLESRISHKTKLLIVQCGMSLLQSLIGICVCVLFFLFFFCGISIMLYRRIFE